MYTSYKLYTELILEESIFLGPGKTIDNNSK